MKVTITLATLGGALATTTASVTVSPDPCAAVYNSCVQSGITMAGGPNFAYCGAQSEACLSTAMPVTTSMSTATTSYNNCGLVYDSCVASGLSMAGGPNYAYCGAQSEECLKTAMPSTISSAYVVISTSVSSASATTDACYSVYESCVQSGITMLGGPNFAYCGAQSEACLKTAMPSSVASMTAKTTLVAPTTKPKPTGAVYTTKVVTAYTTYCPYPTTISVAPGKTITVTSATTLTITDCPCTVTMPKPMPSASIPMGPGPISIPSSAVVVPASSTTSAGAVYTGGAQKFELEIVGVAVAGIAAFLI